MYFLIFLIFVWVLSGIISLYFTAVYINKITKDLKKLDQEKYQNEIILLESSLWGLISKEAFLAVMIMGPFMIKNFYEVKANVLKFYKN